MFLILACTADKDGETGDTPAPGTGHLADANNYAYDGTIDLPVVETASATGDITIEWSGLVEDLQCHELDPAADIDVVGLVRFGTLTQTEVEEGLAANDLYAADMTGYISVEVDGVTSTTMNEMTFLGTPVDIATEYYEGGGTYLMLMTTGTTLGVGARTLGFLQPSAMSSVLDVAVGNACGMLEFQVDLEALTPIQFGADLMLDWSDVTADGQGNPFDPTVIDSVMIARYDLTLPEVEAQFLDLELIAAELYTVPVESGSSVDLSTAAGFPGFSAEGTWVVGLRCSRCYNPAPPFLTVVVP